MKKCVYKLLSGRIVVSTHKNKKEALKERKKFYNFWSSESQEELDRTVKIKRVCKK